MNYLSKNYGRAEIIVPPIDPSIDSSEKDIYGNFILSNVSESWGDQLSLYNSYDQWWVKSLGNKPSVRRFSGLIPDEYEPGFQLKYLTLWKLSACLRDGRKLSIVYKNRAISGYMVNLIISHKKKGLPQFSFDFIVVGKETLFKIGGDTRVNYLDFNRNVEGDDPDMKAMIYKTPLPVSLIEGPPLPDINRNFILTSLEKIFTEKYRISDIGDRDFNIISFGSKPSLYRCIIMVSDYIDENNSSWEYEFLTKLKEEWRIGEMTGNEKLNLMYKSRVASGYVVNVGGSVTTSAGMGLSFDFMAIDENGLKL